MQLFLTPLQWIFILQLCVLHCSSYFSQVSRFILSVLHVLCGCFSAGWRAAFSDVCRERAFCAVPTSSSTSPDLDLPLSSAEFPLQQGSVAEEVPGSQLSPVAELEKSQSVATAYKNDFLTLLALTEAQWNKKSGDKPITKLMKQNMEVLTKYKLPQDKKLKLATGASRSARLFDRVTPAGIEKRIGWLVNEFNFGTADAAVAISKHPSILNYSVENNLSRFMVLLKEEGATQDELRSMIATHPQILGYGSKFKTLLELMNSKLCMSQNELVKIVLKCPRILSYSIMTATTPTIDKMLEFGFGKDDVIKIATEAPKLIGKNFEGMVQEKVDWLQSDIGLSRDGALHILKSQPILFYSQLNAWQETQEWYLDHGNSHSEFVKFLQDGDYGVLGRRKRGLDAMLQFAITTLKKSREEVLSCPHYFGANFMNQTLPRIAFIDYKDEDITDLSLDALSTASHADFFARFDLEEVLAFKSKWKNVPRDKRMQTIVTRDYPILVS